MSITPPKYPKLSALILSQFHIKKGFTIIHIIQSQPHITQSQFTIYSQLILYQDQLCDRYLVSEYMDRYYIIGIPLLSVNKDKKDQPYVRMKYLYAVSVLVEKELYGDQGLREVYREIVGKLAHFFKFVEESSNIIYKNHEPENNHYLHNLLHQTFTQINSNQQCVLSHFSNCFTILNLNRCPFQRDRSQIKKSHVPLTYLLQEEIEDVQSQFGKKLLHYARIGDFNVRKICQLMEDQEGVLRYYGRAMEMGVVFMGDMFSLENRYCLTSKIHRFVGERSTQEDLELQSICQQITLKKPQQSPSTTISPNYPLSPQSQKPTPNMLLYLYFQLTRKTPLKKLIDTNLLLFTNINILKWIRISQIHGLIKRVHQKFGIQSYNVSENLNQMEFIGEEKVRQFLQVRAMRTVRGSGGSGGGNVKEEWERMNSMFNAHLRNMDTLDQICVSFKVSRSVLLGLLNFHNQKNLKIYYVSQ